jgi:hypothetical protein
MALKDYSTTAASNTSISGVSAAEGAPMSNMNNLVRQLAADLRTALGTGPTDIVCAATINLASSDDLYMRVTGSTGPVTSFGTVATGIWRLIRWASTPTITHNATSMILPTGADITVVAGDIWLALSEGSGNWRIAVLRGAGAASGAVTTSGLTMATDRLLGRDTTSTGAIEELSVTAPLSITGGALAPALAAKADQEAGTSAVTLVTPSVQQYHPSACKAWVEATFAGGSAAAYNVSSVSDVNTGIVGPNWDIDFSSSAYFADACPKIDPSGATSGTITGMIRDTSFAAGGCRADSVRVNDGTSVDVTHLMIAAFGDQ